MSDLPLSLKVLSRDNFAPYGWALGAGSPGTAPPAGETTFTSPATDFWHEHTFNTGNGENAEFLWVNYRDDSREIAVLEMHHATQQAVIPLNGDLVQVVACSGSDGQPDLATLAAFRVASGQGVCMMPQCWHTTRILTPTEVRCVMLSNPDTTLDLVHALNHDRTPTRSSFATIAPHRWES